MVDSKRFCVAPSVALYESTAAIILSKLVIDDWEFAADVKLTPVIEPGFTFPSKVDMDLNLTLIVWFACEPTWKSTPLDRFAKLAAERGIGPDSFNFFLELLSFIIQRGSFC